MVILLWLMLTILLTIPITTKQSNLLNTNFTEHGLGKELRMAVVLVLVLSTLLLLQKGDVQNSLLALAENVLYASSVLLPLLSSLPLS
jgi:hypothetical protein